MEADKIKNQEDMNEKEDMHGVINEDMNTDKLTIDDFELNNDSNKDSQALFYFALVELIDIYNNKSKKICEEIGIYVIKEENIMICNIAEEIVEKFSRLKYY